MLVGSLLAVAMKTNVDERAMEQERREERLYARLRWRFHVFAHACERTVGCSCRATTKGSE